MAVNPNTPGVYIDEIPVLPASVAEVATAVPAFIGYVQKAEKGGVYLALNEPVRITSLMEYESMFGTAEAQGFQIDIDDVGTSQIQRNIKVSASAASNFKMYYQVKMFYANGGGPCYIVPVGLCSATGDPASVSASDINTGLDAIAKYDEPTLLVMPDAVALSAVDMGPVYDHALLQCATLKDRFTIMDVKCTSSVSTDASDFRSSEVGINDLKYGAAYYPDLDSTLGYETSNTLLHINSYKKNGVAYYNTVGGNYTDSAAIAIDILNKLDIATYKFGLAVNYAKRHLASLTYNAAILTGVTSLKTNLDAVNSALPSSPAATSLHKAIKDALIPGSGSTLSTLIASANSIGPGDLYDAASDYSGAQNSTNAGGLLAQYTTVLAALNTLRASAYTAVATKTDFVIGSLDFIKTNNPALYNSITAKISDYTVTVSPCGAIAGIYAKVDNERGVWKAPANVSVNAISGPVISLTNAQQDGLNVDATSGKSINCIRSFTGRGTIVWGARTLAGNDNEWRYVNVRRFFNFVEESVQKATGFVVFEPNTSTTWLRVKTMIEAFLTNLWREGALAGASTKEAFFVRVGLGTTMSADDVLNGKMIVEVGMAASRPAEFIILKFEHKLQES